MDTNLPSAYEPGGRRSTVKVWPTPLTGITSSGTVASSSNSSASARSTATDTPSSTCSDIVLVQLNCSTMWLSNTCLTQKMAYSVSSSVSRTGSALLNTSPSAASCGMLLMSSRYSSVVAFLTADVGAAPPVLVVAALVDVGSPPRVVGARISVARLGTVDMSKGLSVGPARYSASCFSSADSDTSGCAEMAPGPPAVPPSCARYSVARSRTSSSLSSSARCSSVMTRGRSAGTCAPKLASDDTAAARTVAFSRMMRL
mmetsp:Transcript_62/g.101  ORF Transcript_62/g.101 Transcript_62/m.101 type:complete len:258 (+) Transcript_62:1916-2689(+)